MNDTQDTAIDPALDPALGPGRARRRNAHPGLVVFLVLFLGVALLVLGLAQLYGLAAVRAGWDRVAPAVIAVKWAGMLVLIWQWRRVIDWGARRLHMSQAERDHLLGLRWRAAGALLILEVLFGQNLLARLLN
jgi:hypothetical protein